MMLVRTRILLYSFSPAAPTYPSQHRWISSTTRLSGSWMNKIKGVFTGQKPTSSDDPSESITAESFTLPRFADGLKNAKRLGTFKQYMVGRSSEATFVDAFEKQESILRYLGGLDPTGEEDHKHLFLGSADGPEDTCLEGLSYTPFNLKGLHNLQSSQTQEAAKHCKCTVADVENALAKFTWAKEAQKKMEKLKEEGKPMPTSMAEVQKLMGSTPMDVAQSNLAKSGQISRNAMCPCGSKKRYKRCCGKD